MSVASCEKDEKPAVIGVDPSVEEGGFKRYGRAGLIPIPSDDPQDPLNWPAWRKNTLLLIVAFHGMQGPFGAATVIPAFEDFTAEFGVSLNKAAYLASIEILFLGIMPILWSPLSERIGRRPVYLMSALLSSACALAGAFCHSYGSLMATRVLQATFICPPQSIGACTVSEMFFEHEKGRKMGIWVLLVVLGPMTAPLVTGYLVQNKGWQASLCLLAAIHLFLFFAHLLFGPETLHPNRVPSTALERPLSDCLSESFSSGSNRGKEPMTRKWYHLYAFRVHNRTPFCWIELWRPFTMAARPLVLLAAFGIAIPFAYVGVLMTVFVPQIFGAVFHLTPGQVGLQFIALIIGASLGEQLAGPCSDFIVNTRAKRTGIRVPEYRLLLAYPGFVLCIVGIIFWGVELQHATPGVWTVTPDIGSAIGMVGVQLVISVCTTYAIESYPTSDAADISAFLTVVRQVFAFIAPFYLPIPFASWGDAKACGLFSGLVVVGALMVLACHRWGQQWRAQRSVL